MKGYIVAFSFGKGAREEVARVKKEGVEISLVTVQDILDKKFSVLPLTEPNVAPKKTGKRKPRTTVTQAHLFGKRKNNTKHKA